MKRISIFSTALLAVCAAFVSCNKEHPVENEISTTHSISFVADQAETKTTMTIGTDKATFEWEDADKANFHVYENDAVATNVQGTINSDGKMAIAATFSGAAPAEATYYAHLNGDIRTQSPDASCYDDNADVLVAEFTPESGASSIDGKLLSFERVVAINKMTLKGIPAGEKVQSVMVTSANADLAGIYEKNDWTDKVKSLTINPDDVSATADGAVIYFTCLPAEQAMLTVEVTTKDNSDQAHLYKKDFQKAITFTKGNVKPFNVNLEGCEVALQEVVHTISWTSSSEWATDTEHDTFSLTTQPYGYGVVLKKNDGATEPTVNATAKDCRLYAKGTATISNAKDITKIVFNISTQGLKRLAPITASVGTITEQKSGDKTVVWTGKAKQVTFTVGEKSDYGTESGRAGQLLFSTIDATYLDDGTPDPGPEQPTEYNISVDGKIIGGTVSADKEQAVAGAQVTLSYEAEAGYVFDSWNVTNASTSAAIEVNDGKFIMPAADVNISATFNTIPTRPENEIFYESFDTNEGTGGNDDKWSGSIASSAIKLDNNNWTLEKANGANYCAKFGTGSVLGSATTPSLGVACNATLTFKAAAWNADNENTILKLSVIGGGIISPATVTMKKGAWTDFNVTLTGITASSKVKFEGNAASNSRFFLDEVSIVKTGEATATYSVTVDNNIANGSVTASPTTAIAGTTVDLKATPETGYEFESWNVTGATVADETSETTTFTMPAANVRVSATFKEIVIPDKTIAEFIAAEGVDCYLTGTVSNITNTTYGNFDLTDGSGTIYIFGCLTPAGEDQKFSNLGVGFGDKIKVHASEYVLYNGTHEAKDVFFVEILKKATKYNVNVASGIANGSITVNPTQAAEGQTVTITATPNAGYKFKDGSITVTKASGGNVAVTDNKFTMPAEAVTVSAVFEEMTGGDPVTKSFDFSAQNYTNQQAIESVTIDSNVTATFDKGSNNSNAPKYYTSGTAVRCYGGNTIKISAAGKTITAIKLTFGSSDGTNDITTAVGKFSSPNWSGKSDTVVFTIGGTSGNRRIMGIEVTYE